MTGRIRKSLRSATDLTSLLASAPLEGVDLTRQKDSGRNGTLPREVGPITDEFEYRMALEAIEAYFNEQPDPGTPGARHFDELAKRISDYEDELEAQTKTSE